MGVYGYFTLGVILGIAISVYLWVNREEKIEKRIVLDQKIYSTEKLDKTMEKVVNVIDKDVKRLKRQLTDDEKNKIIVDCYKDEFLV